MRTNCTAAAISSVPICQRCYEAAKEFNPLVRTRPWPRCKRNTESRLTSSLHRQLPTPSLGIVPIIALVGRLVQMQLQQHTAQLLRPENWGDDATQPGPMIPTVINMNGGWPCHAVVGHTREDQLLQEIEGG